LIDDADTIIVGPGSIYTSVLPHFLIGEVREAAKGKEIIYIANISNDLRSTEGFTLKDYLSALKEIDTPEKKIITVEDPVEYTLGGSIVQTSINPLAGYTFAKAIKAFLRHDPDVMLVGEIRDLETARIAVEASLTGHLVFSTLHTNDAVSTITRLEEMGIESYLLADSLLLICAQRLVKKICSNCKTEYRPSKKEEIVIKNAGFEIDENTKLYKGLGCKLCNFTGYKGRTGIHELLKVDEEIKGMLIEKRSTEEIKQAAARKGMKTLRQDAVMKALEGITTIDEVIKVTIQ